MNARFLTRLCLAAAFLLSTGTAQLFADPAKVTAQIDPEQIGMGEAAQMTVTIQGSASGQPSLPSVSGLQFTPVGQSSNFQWINGSISNSTSYNYQVTADRPGTYVIPEIAVGNLRTNRLTLTVGSGNGNSQGGNPNPAAPLSPPATAPGQGQGQGQGQAQGDDQTAAPAGGDVAFLRMVLPKKEFYVGETVPVQLRAYFRGGTQASYEAPTLGNDSFTINPIGNKPNQNDEMIGSQPYTVLTWDTSLSAVKAGSTNLDLSMPVVLLFRQRIQRPRGGLFDDPFFDQAFGAVVKKQVVLHNDSPAVKILPLPTDNRPADFSGAVGDFSVSADVTPREAAEGDPLSLKFQVSGHGTFDRVAPTLLTGATGWKTYAPNAHFEPQDSVGYQGVKTFEQAIVPAEPGKRQVPSLSFSYFDPDARHYVTKNTAPVEVAITAAPASAAVAPSGPAPDASAPTATSDLAANAISEGAFVPSLRPVFLHKWFYALQAMPLLALGLAIVLIGTRRRREADLGRRRREERDRAVQAHLAALDRAAAAGDAVLFFEAARGTLQQHFGELWQLPPGTITLAEIEARGAASEGTRAIFERADEIAYSGQRFGADDFARWKQAVVDELKPVP